MLLSVKLLPRILPNPPLMMVMISVLVVAVVPSIEFPIGAVAVVPASSPFSSVAILSQDNLRMIMILPVPTIAL